MVMRIKHVFSMAVAIAVLAEIGVGCKRDPAPSGEAKPATAISNNNVSTKPTSSVAPGSYEDWCEEHQVPESQCTKCNPDLIPAFKATGDWCKEHDVPESQCTKCDAKRRAVRPPKKS